MTTPTTPLLATEACRLEWICDECSRPIDDGDGWLTIDTAEAMKRSAPEFLKKTPKDPNPFIASVVDIRALLAYEFTPTIRTYHADCDPSDGGYWFEIGEIRTFDQVIDWNGHLSDKKWIRGTEWHEVVERAWRQVAARIEVAK